MKRRGRDISGVLLFDKPAGLSSNGALQHVRKLMQAARAGHTGTLDPAATGLLPLCFGEATKFASGLLDADKAYRARIRLGVTTATGDAEGETLAVRPVAVTPERLRELLGRFTGPLLQVPPMYSALKHKGRPLYSYARAGTEVERAPRQVFIHQLVLEALLGDEAVVTVACSKGTYIRVLAEDIGEALGCGAHLSGLRRTRIGGLLVEDAVSLEGLEAMASGQRDALLLPPDALLADMPRLELDGDAEAAVFHGREIAAPGHPPGRVRLYGPSRGFIGLGEVGVDGAARPLRLLAEGAARVAGQSLPR